MVCPTCRGMRWLRTGTVDGGIYTVERCERCRDADQEMAAIDRYLGNWLVTHPMNATTKAEAQHDD